ncbi:MAG: hypothetical protein AAF213_12300 [Pseudomonadota bacterium]
MSSPSIIMPSGPQTHNEGADNTLKNGPVGWLRRALATASDHLPNRKSLGFSIALAAVALPSAAMACNPHEHIPVEPPRDFAITAQGVDCVWFDSPVLANTPPINQNTVTRICAQHGVDRFSRGVAPLGEGPPSHHPGIPVHDHLATVAQELAALGEELTATAKDADPDYQPPEGSFHVAPLAAQTGRAFWPSGRAASIVQEVASVSAVTPIDPALCERVQATTERALNADQIAWRRDGILQYDADYAGAANDAYREWQREDDARRQRSLRP